MLSIPAGSANRRASVKDSALSMRTLFVVHRHGDRSPIRTYPKDPYGDPKYWPDGWSQLTIAGKQRLYKLGKFLRRHYAYFLTSDPREVKVRSSGAFRVERQGFLCVNIAPERRIIASFRCNNVHKNPDSVWGKNNKG